MAPQNRMAKCRENKKKNADKWNEYLEKDKMRNRNNRIKQKELLQKNKQLLLDKRLKDRERQRLCRIRKKNKSSDEACNSELGTYKSPRTLCKALNRVKTALPTSPGKKTAVVKRLIRDHFGDEVSNKLFKSKKSGPRKMDQESINKVTDFYNNDEISRQAPGKRDVKSVKDPATGKRSLVQLRHMVMDIGEAYEEFKKSNPDQNISKSKFYNLRPQNILPVNNMPHNVCVCKSHANFTFLIEAISKSQTCFPKTHAELLERMCCDTNSAKCMFSECNECVSDVRSLIGDDCDYQKQLKWKEWTTIESKPTPVENCTTLHNMVIQLNSQLQGFKAHSFIKRTQSAYFATCKRSLIHSPNEAVMQIDFAENYTLTEQDEIQSHYWNKRQVTIFTCCVWHLSKVYSFAVISDDLRHSKVSVWVFVRSILIEVRKLTSKVDHVYIFSDNCAGQFKNRYTCSNVCFSKTDFCVNIEWNFFAAGHGKGAVDGVGGSVKRTVWNAVKGRQAYVHSAKDFYHASAEKCKGICVLFVSQEEVESHAQLLNTRWSSVREISGIHSMHHFQAYDENNILVGKTAHTEMEKLTILRSKTLPHASDRASRKLRYEDVYSDSSSDESFANPEGIFSAETRQDGCETDKLVTRSEVVPGVFVLVRLLSSKGKEFRYVAVCQSGVKENGEVDVAFMKMYGQNKKLFRINAGDEKIVFAEDILQVLSEPQIKTVGDRFVYEFKQVINIFEQ